MRHVGGGTTSVLLLLAVGTVALDSVAVHRLGGRISDFEGCRGKDDTKNARLVTVLALSTACWILLKALAKGISQRVDRAAESQDGARLFVWSAVTAVVAHAVLAGLLSANTFQDAYGACGLSPSTAEVDRDVAWGALGTSAAGAALALLTCM